MATVTAGMTFAVTAAAPVAMAALAVTMAAVVMAGGVMPAGVVVLVDVLRGTARPSRPGFRCAGAPAGDRATGFRRPAIATGRYRATGLRRPAIATGRYRATGSRRPAIATGWAGRGSEPLRTAPCLRPRWRGHPGRRAASRRRGIPLGRRATG